MFTVELFEEVTEYKCPRIVIPIISPADADEGAYVSFPVPLRKKHNAVGASRTIRGFVHGLCK